MAMMSYINSLILNHPCLSNMNLAEVMLYYVFRILFDNILFGIVISAFIKRVVYGYILFVRF